MPARLSTLLQSEGGYTLVELLVAIVSGIVVTGALMLVITTSQHQEARITDHVQADQIGRNSLERVQDELHSSCIGNMPPIQGFSSRTYKELEALNGRNLWFVSTYGTPGAGESATKEGYLHDINWTSTGTSNTGEKLGTLTDYQFKNQTATMPWTFISTLSPSTANVTRVLAHNVTPLEGGKPGGTTLFHYFRYETTTANLVEMVGAELPPASETASYKVAQVRIEYQQAPEYSKSKTTADTRVGHTTTVSGAIVLRFTPSETTEEGTATCA